ncbi:MAG: PH domain-containing protein [Pseudoxanthomonas sp.]
MSAVQDAAPPPPAPPTPDDWQPLPSRGARLAAGGGAIGLATTLLIATIGPLFLIRPDWWWQAMIGIGIFGLIVGAWVGVRRHRATHWRLDADGLGLRRGRWWQTETRVPLSRVQHLDLKRGPLERAVGLSTLIVHTAGTRLNAVAVGGLDQHDAERLRDRLARQLDHDDDAL